MHLGPGRLHWMSISSVLEPGVASCRSAFTADQTFMKIINSKVRFIHLVDGERTDRGYEQQRYVFHEDGTLTLNAFSIASDHGISRDVVINLDCHYRPIDSYVRIHAGSQLEGVGWYEFRQGGVDSEIWNARLGRRRDTCDIPGGVKVFSGHPIAFDSLFMTAFDRTKTESTQLIDTGLVLSSSHHFGATGPEIFQIKLELEYVGAETIQTPAGQFEADHWRIVSGSEKTGHTHPGEEIWTKKDSFIFLAGALPSVDYTYELTDYEELEK